jgi:WD40 repeat protein
VYCGTSCGNGIIYHVDIITGDIEIVFDGKWSKKVPTNWDHDIWSLALSPDGKDLAIGLRMGVVVWNLADQNERFSVLNSKSAATSLAFSPDGKHLAISANTITIWDCQTGNRISELKSSGSLAFSPDGTLLVAGISGAVNFPSEVAVWKTNNYSQSVVFPCHTDCLRAVSFINATNKLVTGSNDKTICIWNLEKLSWPKEDTH